MGKCSQFLTVFQNDLKEILVKHNLWLTTFCEKEKGCFQDYCNLIALLDTGIKVDDDPLMDVTTMLDNRYVFYDSNTRTLSSIHPAARLAVTRAIALRQYQYTKNMLNILMHENSDTGQDRGRILETLMRAVCWNREGDISRGDYWMLSLAPEPIQVNRKVKFISLSNFRSVLRSISAPLSNTFYPLIPFTKNFPITDLILYSPGIESEIDPHFFLFQSTTNASSHPESDRQLFEASAREGRSPFVLALPLFVLTFS